MFFYQDISFQETYIKNNRLKYFFRKPYDDSRLIVILNPPFDAFGLHCTAQPFRIRGATGEHIGGETPQSFDGFWARSFLISTTEGRLRIIFDKKLNSPRPATTNSCI
jgi:hypothetical protein